MEDMKIRLYETKCKFWKKILLYDYHEHRTTMNKYQLKLL